MKPLESLLRVFIELHPEDAARAFETLSLSDGVRLLTNLPVRVAVPLLEHLSPHAAGPFLEQLDVERLIDLLKPMSSRACATVLNQFSEATQASVLDSLPEDQSRLLRQLAEYPTDTAGGFMQTQVFSLPLDLTAQQAISAIRKAPRAALHYLYVTRRSGELIGVMNMRDLLIAASKDKIEALVKRDVLSIPSTMDREEVVNLMRERRFLALPVTDFDGRLVGVVKHGDVLEAGQIEAFEDFQKLVGAGAEERALSPVSVVVKSRFPWLLVNLVTAFMAASVIGLFEDMISAIAALAVLLPVVAGQGGNTGSQSLAVVMRGLALREILPGTKKRVIYKEILGGLFNGIGIAVVTAVAVFAWRYFSQDSLFACSGLSLVIFLAMIVNMVVAAAAGAVIPLILRSLGRDPAQSAAIFLTTVTDIVGFAAFLGFATVFKPMIVPGT